MKKLELENFEVQTFSKEEMNEIKGGVRGFPWSIFWPTPAGKSSDFGPDCKPSKPTLEVPDDYDYQPRPYVAVSDNA